ncbi:FUSC family protein [Gordonia sp. zg691]|uniref:FUSC family protein n=1 Tax=Gordonia jinghuaiqii TaxID=2758710 RepID=UPI001662502D|nr:FUSC family protein [Gordonia jinghuaiqii]MBD0861018.1 FUSC family protein [Gordonia jinghuaiqii]
MPLLFTPTARDPGARRLLKASRAAVAVTIAASVVAATRAVADVGAAIPEAAELGAGILAMWATVGAVKDTTARARLVTTLLLVPAGLLAAVLVCALHALPAARPAGFILLAGLAAWATGFGPRGSAVGVFGFFTYFFGIVMNVGFGDLPMLGGLVLLAVGTALLIRRVLLRDNPSAGIARLLASTRAGADDLLRTALMPNPDPEKLYHAVGRLSAATRAVGDWQNGYETSRYLDVDAETLARRVSAMQVTCEQAAYGIAAEHDPDVLAAAAEVRGVLRSRPRGHETGAAGTPTTATTGSGARPGTTSGSGSTSGSVRAAFDAAARVSSINVLRHPVSAAPPGAGEHSGPAPGGAGSGGRKPPDARRFAVQVMVATAGAIGVGELISASRWYWAVLSAFMIFNGVASRGAILTKAVKRVEGTVVGLVVGVALVVVVGHHPTAQYVVIVAAVFLAYYLFPISYMWTILFITVIVTTSYDLLGVLDPHILEWRIEETLAGAAVGTAATFLVLTTPGDPVLPTRLRNYFDVLTETVTTALQMAQEAPRGPDSAGDAVPTADELLVTTRRLDAAEASIIDSTSAVFFSLGRVHRMMFRQLHPHLLAVTREAHGLAWSVMIDPHSAPPDETADVDRLRKAAEAVLAVVENREDHQADDAISAVAISAVAGAVEEDPDVRPPTPAEATPARQVGRIADSVAMMAVAARAAQRRARRRSLLGRAAAASHSREFTRRG